MSNYDIYASGFSRWYHLKQYVGQIVITMFHFFFIGDTKNNVMWVTPAMYKQSFQNWERAFDRQFMHLPVIEETMGKEFQTIAEATRVSAQEEL